MPTTVTFPPVQTWSLQVTLAGVDVSARLTGSGYIEAEENTATTAQFSLRWNTDTANLVTVNLAAFTNNDVIINGRANPEDAYTRLFTGKVDYSEYDRNLRVITFTCSDKLKQIMYDAGINDPAGVQALVPGSIASEDAFSTYVDGYSLYEDLLDTVRADVSVNANGNVVSTPWDAKATADYLFTADAVEDASLALDMMDANEIVTQLALRLEYSFPRLFQHVIQYSWQAFVSTGAFPTTGFGGGPSGYLSAPYGLPTKDMWAAAVSGTGWTRASAIGVMSLPENGEYGGKGYAASAEVRATTFSYVGFRLMRRWAQTRKVLFDVLITTAESALYGTVNEEENASASYDYDTEGWGSSRDTRTPSLSVSDPDNPWDGFTFGPGLSGTGGSYHRDKYGQEVFDGFVGAVSARALRRMHNGFRQNFVTFVTGFCPWISKAHTVEVNAVEVHAKGKVYQHRHEWDIASGALKTTIRTAHCLGAGGSASAPSLTMPSKTYAPLKDSYGVLNKIGGVPGTPELQGDETNVWLTNYAGVLARVEPEEPGAPDTEQGEVNVRVVAVDENPDLYPQELRIRPDDVPTEVTDATEETVQVAHNVGFPADLFVVKA